MAKRLIIIMSLLLVAVAGGAQVKLRADTLECHIVGFSAGLMQPGWGSASGGLTGGGVADLYKGPFLDFAIECDYKYQSNWMVTLEGDLWFGYNSDNLKGREQRMSNIYTDGGYVLSWGGYDGAVTAYNRSLSARVGVAKIIPLFSQNPNSGLLLKLSGGWMMQKTVFSQDVNESPVPQLQGDYAKLYDHLRNGAIISEGIGIVYMSNYRTYVNFKLTFEVSECLNFSSRPYQLDNLMGLNSKDNNRYFDLMYGVKLSWMFPLMGKTTYDYYYY